MEKHELVLSDVHVSIPYTILPSESKMYKDVIPINLTDDLFSERHNLAVSRLKIFYKNQGPKYEGKSSLDDVQLTRKKACKRDKCNTEIDTHNVRLLVSRNPPVNKDVDLYERTNQSSAEKCKPVSIDQYEDRVSEGRVFPYKENHTVLIDNAESSSINNKETFCASNKNHHEFKDSHRDFNPQESCSLIERDDSNLKPGTNKDVNLRWTLDGKNLCCDKNEQSETVPPSASDTELDEDGDYVVKRRKVCVDEDGALISTVFRKGTTSHQIDTTGKPDPLADVSYITIVHQLATHREDVGQQVWQGALLLSEYILSHPNEFTGRVIVDLGAGVGLTSVITGIFAKRVFSTDLLTSIMRLAEYNAQSNLELSGKDKSVVKVKRLDWMTDWSENCRTSTLSQALSDKFSWTETDEQELDNLEILLAADVVYDEDLTEGFFRTFHHFMSKPPSKTLYIGLEKRLLFTLIKQDVCCPAYSHFRECLEDLSLCNDNGLQYHVKQLPTDFPQCFQYRRIPQLELWKISTTFSLSIKSDQKQ